MCFVFSVKCFIARVFLKFIMKVFKNTGEKIKGQYVL